ncbi:MAG: hypothetical protein KGQ79_05500 [Proteobacteria bacterium]|nr:hypothetical protein [Pseudomonadota bacterium]
MSSLKYQTTGLVRGKTLERPTGGLTAKLALDAQTKADAYSIRHASYLSGGYIDPRPDGMFSDADDLLPNSRSVVIYKEGRPAASVRLCTWSNDPNLQGWNDIPAARIFPEEVEALAQGVQTGKPAKLTEINRLVRHPDDSNDFMLVFVLYRFVSFLVIEEGSDMMLNCVRRNHTSFYKRMHFEYVAGPRRYAGVKFETNLMICPDNRYEKLMSDIPFVATDASTKRAYGDLLAGETVKVFAD